MGASRALFASNSRRHSNAISIHPRSHPPAIERRADRLVRSAFSQYTQPSTLRESYTERKI